MRYPKYLGPVLLFAAAMLVSACDMAFDWQPEGTLSTLERERYVELARQYPRVRRLSVIVTGESLSCFDPKNIAYLQELSDYLAEDPAIEYVRSLASALRVAASELGPDLGPVPALPSSEEELAALLRYVSIDDGISNADCSEMRLFVGAAGDPAFPHDALASAQHGKPRSFEFDYVSAVGHIVEARIEAFQRQFPSSALTVDFAPWNTARYVAVSVAPSAGKAIADPSFLIAVNDVVSTVEDSFSDLTVESLLDESVTYLRTDVPEEDVYSLVYVPELSSGRFEAERFLEALDRSEYGQELVSSDRARLLLLVETGFYDEGLFTVALDQLSTASADRLSVGEPVVFNGHY